MTRRVCRGGAPFTFLRCDWVEGAFLKLPAGTAAPWGLVPLLLPRAVRAEFATPAELLSAEGCLKPGQTPLHMLSGARAAAFWRDRWQRF